jgi:hypothetical protein
MTGIRLFKNKNFTLEGVLKSWRCLKGRESTIQTKYELLARRQKKRKKENLRHFR